MSLFTSTITIASGSTSSNSVTLPANCTNVALSVPAGSTGGPYYIGFSYDNGATFNGFVTSISSSTVVSLSGVALLGSAQMKLITTTATSSAISVVFRYRTEETLNSSFLLT